MGGLGNQMFQYAAGRSLAHQHEVPLELDLSWFRRYTSRTFSLNYLNISAPVAANVDLRKLNRSHWPTRIRNCFQLYERCISYYKRSIYEEPYFHFDKNFFHAPRNVILSGYWQSEKYFRGIEDVLRKEFEVSSLPTKKNKYLAEAINSTVSVGIHVRRVDYVEDKKTNLTHGVLSKEYYLNCVNLMCAQLDNPCFFVFSDDPLWARENLIIVSPVTFVSHNGSNEDYEDLRLMSICKHQIIANSSFSWWAAWLNRYPDKKVMVPKRWFNVSDNDTKDLYPSTWYVIDT